MVTLFVLFFHDWIDINIAPASETTWTSDLQGGPKVLAQFGLIQGQNEWSKQGLVFADCSWN